MLTAPPLPCPDRAVILVAGRGQRLGLRTERIPKCLIAVNGRPILQNTLQTLEQAGVGESVLVVGYLGGLIRQQIGHRWGRMRIEYHANLDYEDTNTSRSLRIGLEGLEGDVLVIEGDVFFERPALRDLLNAPQADATLVERWNPALDGSVVCLGPDRIVRAWIHKKDRPAGFNAAGTFKTVNLHKFSRQFLREQLRPALAAESARGGREPIETVFATLVNEGSRIHAVEVSGGWVEIDDERDLRTAETMFPGVMANGS